MKSLIPLALLALLGSGPASAQGINLFWDDCAIAGGTVNRYDACNTNFGAPSRLVVSLETPEAIDGIVAVQGSIVLTIDGLGIPDFWRLDSEGCRPDALSTEWTVTGATECVPLAQSTGGGDTATFYPNTTCAPNRATILWSVTVPEAVSLDAGKEHVLIRIVIRRNGTLDCAGCVMPACFGVPWVRLLRASGDPRGDVTITQTALNAFVTWQGGGTLNCEQPWSQVDCPVPTRGSTWGRVKSMYR